VFRWAETGDLVHTGNMITNGCGKGFAIWVCSPDRRFYTASHDVSTFHHSSFLAGMPVLGAGEWSIDRGRLIAISNKSGHYRPGFEEMFRAMLRLKVNGVDMSSVSVHWIRTAPPQDRFYRATDFMRARPASRFSPLFDQAGKPLTEIPRPPVPAPLPAPSPASLAVAHAYNDHGPTGHVYNDHGPAGHAYNDHGPVGHLYNDGGPVGHLYDDEGE
jgi:hypothetical protein